MKITTFFPLVALTSACFLSSAKAQTVSWGTSVWFEPLSYNSDGAVDNELNLWTIGYFTSGFVPDATNYLDWGANWNPISNPTGTPDPVSGDLTNVPRHRLDTFWSTSVTTVYDGTAGVGQDIYMFAYNDLGLIGTPDGEALLYRQNGLTVVGNSTLPYDFDVNDAPTDPSDNTFTVIWGQVDRDIDGTGGLPDGGVITGGGVFPAQLTNATANEWEVQFGSWPIPEPSTSLMVFLAAGGLMARRRRS